MQRSTEYVVSGSAPETYASLETAVRERKLAIVYSDGRHLTLTFRPEGTEWGASDAVRCAVLDAGHGIAKLVLSGVTDDGSRVELGAAPLSLLAAVEQRVRPRGGSRSDELIRR